ncbi:Bcr/CflA family multidrug efflux MFS transporter [Pandoraea nosoerga]|uniref:Bcr/CflA family efflux transporter n=1 Tax=Pandoraea nosoerga TaxID=2508296 RepID=A0A5E4UNT3_9BURK|nr:Bcr/CflA family multidrug efflux MFS transporter [Pandoraea nosoerga]MBN4664838.1 Bcr/CflA family multidrug efflux MFS transporter [Pandoraea nosoerga]MBN4673987.1 Bcr/CflA family multidrug efflux MFS transporter [Pandoraea nosoerga]MBN4680078.1 Bcr/CflA family multidrug efflux MFS transporter [Pandoraea nosoerga]MBN4744210.1 Bcr/CflA family multidrug efflux MFS transporter [Pandoraea nosoerga]VVE00020.1 Bcr/CflA family drug resistance efflux transporter [Pandoraea nosoerga]
MSTHYFRTVFVLGILSAIGSLSIDMYLPALPAIARELNTTDAAAQFTLASFFIGLGLGQLLHGPLADRFGRKRPLYAGLALYTLASAGCALAPNIETLIVCRFVQAVGGCACFVIARAMARDLFDTSTVARVLSRMTLIMGAAPILAPLAGGQLLLFVSWRWIFWGLTAFGALCFAMSVYWLPETRAAARGARNWLATAWHNYGVLLRDREFMGNALAGGVAQAGMFAYITGSPFVFINLYGVDPANYGWLFGINACGIIGGSQINAHLLRTRRPADVLRRTNNLVAILGLLLLCVAALRLGGLPGLMVPLFAFVASLGFSQPNAIAEALNRQHQRAGAASALLGALQFLAAAGAGAAVGLLHARSAVPMAAVIAVCGGLSWCLHTVLIRRAGSALPPAAGAA